MLFTIMIITETDAIISFCKNNGGVYFGTAFYGSDDSFRIGVTTSSRTCGMRDTHLMRAKL
ncbi:MAG: hypothetical protein ACREA3_04350 [Nitrosotalea sp.]